LYCASCSSVSSNVPFAAEGVMTGVAVGVAVGMGIVGVKTGVGVTFDKSKPITTVSIGAGVSVTTTCATLFVQPTKNSANNSALIDIIATRFILKEFLSLFHLH